MGFRDAKVHFLHKGIIFAKYALCAKMHFAQKMYFLQNMHFSRKIYFSHKMHFSQKIYLSQKDVCVCECLIGHTNRKKEKPIRQPNLRHGSTVSE